MLTPVELRERLHEIGGEIEELGEGGNLVLTLVHHLEDDCGLHSICCFCRDFSGEWAELLRHQETCQSIPRNRRNRAKFGLDAHAPA